MKIARVVHTFSSESEGDYFGINELCREQVRRGHSVRIYTWAESERPSISTAGRDFVVVRLGGVNLGIPFLFKDYPFVPSMGREIEEGGADLVHAHSHLFLTTYQAGVVARKRRKPFVVTVHGVSAERGFPTDTLQAMYLRSFGFSIFRMASRVVCVSRGDVSEVQSLGCPKWKISLVPNAVDAEFFKPWEGRRENEVLWVGRFVPEKGLDLLLWAFREVLKRHEATLRLVGDGPERPFIEALARNLGVESHVAFEGRVGKNEVASLMARASVFVLPSLKEGLPKVLLQALASELGLVASDIPGVQDVVKDKVEGLLFKKGDVRRLAEALLNLLEEPTLARQLGRNGRRKVMRDFSWDNALKGLDAVYEEACRLP